MSKTRDIRDLLSEDPAHIYTDDELDVIEEIDPALALRLARVQHFTQSHQKRALDDDVEIDIHLLEQAIDTVRNILSMDGGDIELVDIVGRTVQVRMKGACVGCPNAVLDLKNVVEKIIFDRVPGVNAVENTF